MHHPYTQVRCRSGQWNNIFYIMQRNNINEFHNRMNSEMHEDGLHLCAKGHKDENCSFTGYKTRSATNTSIIQMWLHKSGLMIFSISTWRNYTWVLHVSAIEVLHISLRIPWCWAKFVDTYHFLAFKHIVSLVEIPHRLWSVWQPHANANIAMYTQTNPDISNNLVRTHILFSKKVYIRYTSIA